MASVNCFEKKSYPADSKPSNEWKPAQKLEFYFWFHKKEPTKSQKNKKEPTEIPDPTKRSLRNIVTLRLGSCFPGHKWRQNPIEPVDEASRASTRCVSWGLATRAKSVSRLWTFFLHLAPPFEVMSEKLLIGWHALEMLFWKAVVNVKSYYALLAIFIELRFCFFF